jgi:hypothetical protein
VLLLKGCAKALREAEFYRSREVSDIKAMLPEMLLCSKTAKVVYS